MRTLVLAVGALLVAVVTLVGGPRPALACSCALVPLEEYADEVTVAFTGTQIDRTELGGRIDAGALLTFEVDRVYHGDVGPTVTARTAADSAACGVDYGGQGTVSLVAFGSADEPSVNLCGSSVTEDDLSLVFGEAAEPDPDIVDPLADAPPAVPDQDLPIDGGDLDGGSAAPVGDGDGDAGGVPWAVILGVVAAVAALLGLFFAGTVRLGGGEDGNTPS